MKKRNSIIMVLSILALIGIGVFNWQAKTRFSSATAGSEGLTFKGVSPKQALEMIEKKHGNPDFVLLDVRTPKEIRSGYISGAKNIDFYTNNYRDQLDRLDKNQTFLVYCKSGGRSGNTLKTMKELGFKTVYDLLGGFDGWKANKLPYVRP